jgi:uncharacterized membrane protein
MKLDSQFWIGIAATLVVTVAAGLVVYYITRTNKTLATLAPKA